MTTRTKYHHGDLRAALVDAALALIAEQGIDALSVAEAARRTGVSAAAPYRHFPTRLDLLKATATRAAELLATELREAVGETPAPHETVGETAHPRETSNPNEPDDPHETTKADETNKAGKAETDKANDPNQLDERGGLSQPSEPSGLSRPGGPGQPGEPSGSSGPGGSSKSGEPGGSGEVGELIGPREPGAADVPAGKTRDPREQLAEMARVYVRFVVRHHAGLDLIFDARLRVGDPVLAEAGRAVMDVMLPVALEITGDPHAALDLLEKHTAAAHGYAALHLSGFLNRRAPDVEDIADAAAAVSRILAGAT